jgi:single-strand DNA-binding protein
MVPAIAAWNVAAQAVARKAKQLEYDMAKSVNKVILVGNVGQDPEVKYTASGVPVAQVSLATNERFKDRSDQWQDRTEWHSVVAWQRLAEIVGEYVRKGSKLYIEGKLQTSSWEDKHSGERKYRTEVVARDIVLLGARDNGEEAKAAAPSEESNAEPVASGVADSDIPF